MMAEATSKPSMSTEQIRPPSRLRPRISSAASMALCAWCSAGKYFTWVSRIFQRDGVARLLAIEVENVRTTHRARDGKVGDVVPAARAQRRRVAQPADGLVGEDHRVQKRLPLIAAAGELARRPERCEEVARVARLLRKIGVVVVQRADAGAVRPGGEFGGNAVAVPPEGGFARGVHDDHLAK